MNVWSTWWGILHGHWMSLMTPFLWCHLCPCMWSSPHKSQESPQCRDGPTLREQHLTGRGGWGPGAKTRHANCVHCNVPLTMCQHCTVIPTEVFRRKIPSAECVWNDLYYLVGRRQFDRSSSTENAEVAILTLARISPVTWWKSEAGAPKK